MVKPKENHTTTRGIYFILLLGIMMPLSACQPFGDDNDDEKTEQEEKDRDSEKDENESEKDN